MEGSLSLLRCAIIAGVLALVALHGCRNESARTEPSLPNGKPDLQEKLLTREFLSPVFRMDRIYKSMAGPSHTQQISLGDGEDPALVWITGYRTAVVAPDGDRAAPQEFMCHNNLDFDVSAHRTLAGWKENTRASPRLFTLSQGQLSVAFPEGFGLPVLSNEKLSLSTQVLNHNVVDRVVEVRHKVVLDVVRDEDLREPMKPLFPTNAFVVASIEGSAAVFGVHEPSPEVATSSCLPGTHAEAARGSSLYTDKFGRRFSGHWVVKPGPEVRRTRVTEMLAVPYDTTVHFIAVHLHPFAESLELRDMTTGETLFRSEASQPEKGIGLATVDEFSSVEGLPMFRDHEYELVSRYNNTTDVDQDAMATMFLYLADREFQSPLPAVREMQDVRADNEETRSVGAAKEQGGEKRSIDKKPAEVKRVTEGPRGADELIVLHTEFGDIVLELFPDVAPEHVKHILELAKAGVYDTNHFARVQPGFVLQVGSEQDRSAGPLTPRQAGLLRDIDAEFSDIRHTRGVLSMARYPGRPHSARTSFSILLGDAPHLDTEYTVFGRVQSGIAAIDKILQVPRNGTTPARRIEIVDAEIIIRGTDTVARNPDR